MAFPASTGALSQVLENACATAVQMKALAQRERDRLAANNVTATQIIQIHTALRGFRAQFVAVAATPGIGAYAQSQLGDGSLDIAAEFNAMNSAIDGAVNWIISNFPVGTGPAAGYLLAQTWGAEGPVDRTFTPAQTAGLRTQLDALIATVA